MCPDPEKEEKIVDEKETKHDVKDKNLSSWNRKKEFF